MIHDLEEVKGVSRLTRLLHEAHYLFARSRDEVSESLGFWEHDRGRGRVASFVPLVMDLHNRVIPDKVYCK